MWYSNGDGARRNRVDVIAARRCFQFLLRCNFIFRLLSRFGSRLNRATGATPLKPPRWGPSFGNMCARTVRLLLGEGTQLPAYSVVALALDCIGLLDIILLLIKPGLLDRDRLLDKNRLIDNI